MRKAIEDFDMIKEGDKIAVGVSGGKDSLALAVGLNKLQRFYPVHFEIMAITVDLGFPEFNREKLVSFFKEEGISYHIEKTYIGEIVFDVREEKNPCALCANMKRGAMYNTAKRLGCNKAAFGHHMDDAIETLIMSLFYEGKINCFSPVTYLDRRDITLIRPMLYLEEKQIQGFVNKYGIEAVKSGCKMDGETKREEVKHLLASLNVDNKYLKSNLFGAIKRSDLKGWN